MRDSSMNKLARPDCPHCAGVGKLKVPSNPALARMPDAYPKAAPGFVWASCDACGGTGKR